MPSPLPSWIVTLLELEFAVAKSGLPSRLKSPTATERGPDPTLTGEPAALKTPTPSPNKSVTVWDRAVGLARARVRSRLKTLTATALGLVPIAMAALAACLKLAVVQPSSGCP